MLQKHENIKLYHFTKWVIALNFQVWCGNLTKKNHLAFPFVKEYLMYLAISILF